MKELSVKILPKHYHRIPPKANDYYSNSKEEEKELQDQLAQVKKAVAAEIDFNKAWPSGGTLLLAAITNKNSEVIKLLLNAKADPNQVSKSSEGKEYAPLVEMMYQWSGSNKYLETIEFFIDKGAVRNINASNETPITKAIENNNYHALSILLEYNVPLKMFR